MIRERRHQSWALRAAALAGLLALVAAAPASAAYTETLTFSSGKLEVQNLIGEVRVEGHRGSAFEVEVNVQGSGATKDAVILDAGDKTLSIRFPDASDFIYPRLGQESTDLSGRGSDWLSNVGVRGRVEVKRAGKGVELWADVVIRVPRGQELRVRQAVGALIAEDVEADLELSTHDGDVTLNSTRGRLQVATGSGDVQIERASGERARIATGSGDVVARDCTADRIDIATGSGEVEVRGIDSRRLQVATGSGEVTVTEVSADEGQFATGSGTITASLSRMGRGDFSFGTGSGGIVLTLPRGASAEINAETDNGEIEVALDSEARYMLREDDQVRLKLGGGDTKITLGTGSGDIRIRN